MSKSVKMLPFTLAAGLALALPVAAFAEEGFDQTGIEVGITGIVEDGSELEGIVVILPVDEEIDVSDPESGDVPTEQPTEEGGVEGEEGDLVVVAEPVSEPEVVVVDVLGDAGTTTVENGGAATQSGILPDEAVSRSGGDSESELCIWLKKIESPLMCH